MSIRPRPILFLLACVVALIGCGGREESWSRKEAPVADNGEQVRLVVRELEQDAERIQMHLVVENDSDAEVSFPLHIHKTPIMNGVPSPESPTYLEVEGQKVTWCLITTKNVSKYNFGAKFGTISAYAESMDGRIEVGPKGKQTFVLAFFPRPETEKGDAPFSIRVDGIERAGQKLKPLVLDIK
ncbi:MAG TPA: hypothetical protein VEL07_17440 [Planctomycetota bacterium]|nr:hypothetical protein [Planctomycetota bacterium]